MTNFASDNLDVVNISHESAQSEEIEEVQSLSTEVTSSELLQCGDIISRNLEAAVATLRQLSELVCRVLTDRSEAEVIFPLLKRAGECLAITVGHIDSTIRSIDDALIMFYRCLNNDGGQWHKLPMHVKEVQEHTRRVHELWPRNRVFLHNEVLNSLTGQLYSSQSIFPHLALWVARLTRVEHYFPRMHVWGQIPNLIADICAAFDPIPQLLDKLEAYAVDMGDRLQLILSQPSGLQEGQMKMLRPSVNQLVERWAPYSILSRHESVAIQKLDPSRYLSFPFKPF